MVLAFSKSLIGDVLTAFLCFPQKRDRDKEELEKKKEFIQDMRKKTIERLKDFKKVFAAAI